MASPSSYSPKPNNRITTASGIPNNVGFDPNPPPNTTFVQADPSNFRAVVQKLTGAGPNSSTHKLPVTSSNRLPAGKPTNAGIGHRRPSFKLQERRQSGKKLEIKLNNNGGLPAFSPRQRMTNNNNYNGFIGFNGGMVSPVSTLDLFFARGSPRTPVEEEERAIADKGFYLHPSPLTTPRGAEPELLPLFPLHSPKLTHDSSSSP